MSEPEQVAVNCVENHASYDASQVALSGGVSFGGGGSTEDKNKSGIGKDQKGRADNVNPVPGTRLPEERGISVGPPLALSASGEASSTTRSAVSGGAITITDEAKQQTLTGQSTRDIIVNLNRDTSDTGGALVPIFDKEKIEAGFEITGQFVNQVSTFVQNRVSEIDTLKKTANDPNAKDANGNALTQAQRQQLLQQASEIEQTWGAGKPARQLVTALTAAAGGNVTGGVGQFVQSAGVTYLQTLGAEQVKALAPYLGGEGSPAHAALHAVLGCAGGAGSGSGCGTGALGASAGVVLNTALDQLSRTEGLSASEKEARANLVSTIVAGVATVMDTNATGAVTAASVETRFNRQLHDDEKRAIKKSAGDDEELEKRLTRAACYEVKCWAQYKPGSAEYTANYVSQLEASQLQAEFDWVKDQKQTGLFDYTPLQKVGDAIQSDPVGVAKDAVKVTVGGVAVKTGAAICATTGVGCALGGGGMVLFGLSDMAEGASGLYNRYSGVTSPGLNPLRSGFNQLSPTWGDTAYDGASLLFAFGALRAEVPLKMGIADGLNRPGSMFGVTVPRINNPTLIPFVNQALPHGTTKGILWYGIGSKGVTVTDDIRNARDKK